jgi:THUMP domain-like/RNA cap guanine-N2 methyltransferase
MPSGLESLGALRSPAGQDLLRRLAGASLDVALASALRKSYPAELVAAAFSMTELRRLGRAKFGRADQMWFTRDGLEQASAEAVSAHIAERYRGVDRIVDLCTGIGGNLVMLAGQAPVTAVDADPVHLAMAGLNAAVYGRLEVAQVLEDVRRFRVSRVAAVFIDPARRAGSRRLAAGQSEPPLAFCVALASASASASGGGAAAGGAAVGVKVAPGIPADLVPAGWEAEFISSGRQLGGAMLWSPALLTVTRRATLLPSGLTLVPVPGAAVPVAMPGRYLIDPDPAVTRAGLVADLARSLSPPGVWKIDERIGFLSCDSEVRTAFGRTLLVEESLPWSLKRVRSAVRAAGAGSVDIRKRGSAVDADELHRRLDLSGDRRLTLVLTRVLDRPWALVCSDVSLAGIGLRFDHATYDNLAPWSCFAANFPRGVNRPWP